MTEQGRFWGGASNYNNPLLKQCSGIPTLKHSRVLLRIQNYFLGLLLLFPV